MSNHNPAPGGETGLAQKQRKGPKEIMGAVQEAISQVNFSATFIDRPVATSLLSVAVILAGILAYALLPVASVPQVEFPAISVSASFPGADPETMASAIATPLERQFSRIAGINEMTSASSAGSTNITMQFDLDRDVNGAARDVQAAINAARSQLPANLPQNPSYRKVNPADVPILSLALTSDTMTQAQLYDQADSVLGQKIAQVSGVGQVSIGGSAKPAVRIEANPMLLSQTGLGLEALRAAIGSVNVNKPKGYLSDATQRYSIGATDQLFGAAVYAPLIVATNRGPVSSAQASTGLPTNSASAVSSLAAAAGVKASAPIEGVTRLRDIGQVVDSVEDIYNGGMFNGKPAIIININKAAGANVIDTVDKIIKMLPLLQASVPPAVKISVALNRTLSIRESVHDVTVTLAISIVLVIMVVFLFLREVRSTLIPSVSVPLSLFGTFAVMYLLGYTLDNLSLMALTISTGFVVDDAIVVTENITRHLEAGLKPYAAAILGSKEIGFTVLSMSTSLIAVFIPILLMGGFMGRLFREFAVTLAVAILVSLVVSLTTTPMLSARFMQSHDAQRHGRIYRFGESALNWLTGQYDLGLKWVLDHQPFMLSVTVLTFAMNVYLFTIVPKGFFPQMDSGRLMGEIRGQQDVSFPTLMEKAKALAAIAQSEPGVQNVTVQVGSNGGGGGGGNKGNMNLFLKDDAERIKNGWSAETILEHLRRRTAAVTGVTLAIQSSQDVKIGARSSASQFQYSMTSQNLAELDEWAPKLMAAMQKIPQLKDISSDQQNNGLRAQIVIDRDTASRLGVSPLSIDNTLSDAFGQRQVATTYMPLNQYHVVMEVAPEFRDNPDSLKHIFVKSTSGQMVPLSAVTHFEAQRMPLAVNHQSQSPAVTISFNLAPGASLSQATTAVGEARVKIGLPSDIQGGFQGTAQAFQDSLSTEPMLILLALVTVYIVLGILYESLIHPLTILSTLPSAGVGAIVALLLFKYDLSIIAMIGIILLIGIVKKNAIMMIDFALVAEREGGKTPKEAIYEACLLRFRPIMMTTMAALLGGVPLALGTGPGSELRRPLGITIIGGLIVSQCLTLFTTPVVYLFFDRLRLRLRKTMGKRKRMADAYAKAQTVHAVQS
jgi:multidrug efflux pump subunit AcrB